jgi:hypothetical protein
MDIMAFATGVPTVPQDRGIAAADATSGDSGRDEGRGKVKGSGKKEKAKPSESTPNQLGPTIARRMDHKSLPHGLLMEPPAPAPSTSATQKYAAVNNAHPAHDIRHSFPTPSPTSLPG